MADIRIKDLATTATSAASDDYLALDGSANGTRKILATNVAQNVTDVTFGSSGPSAKSSIAARAARQGLVFDGTAGATVSGVGAFGTGDFTVVLSVNVPADTENMTAIGGTAFNVYRNTGDWVFYNGTAAVRFPQAIPTNKTFVALITRASGVSKLYVDGIQVGSDVANVLSFGAPDEIGSSDTLGGANWTGTLRVALYNRALSAAEVVALYESGVPAAGDVQTAGQKNTSAFVNSVVPYTSFSGASATGFTAVQASGTAYASSGDNFTVRVGSGATQVRVSGTVTLNNGKTTIPFARIIASDGTVLSSSVSLNSGVFSVTLTATVASTIARVWIGSTGDADYTISSAKAEVLGLLLAPDAGQAGGGLTWYDTSGNSANITWTSGVTWNVPTSGKTAADWAFAKSVSSADGFTVTNVGVSRGLYLESSSTQRFAGIYTNNAIQFITSNASGGMSVGLGGVSSSDTRIHFKSTVAELNKPLLIGAGTLTDGGQMLQVAGTIASTTNAANNALTARYNSSNSLFGVTINSSGQGTLAENTDASTGTDSYSRTGLPAFRLGNTGGSGTVPFWIDVAASGTAGGAITWTNAFKIDSSQNATFAGGVTVAAPFSSSIITTASAAQVRLGSRSSGRSNVILDSSAGRIWNIENTGTNLTIGYSGLDALVLAETTGNATFAGTVKVKNQATVDANGTVSVGTSATTIFSALNTAAGNFCFIFGDNGSHGFADIVVTVGGGNPVAVISSSTIYGSPPARTYTSTGSSIQLALASGTLAVRTTCINTGA